MSYAQFPKASMWTRRDAFQNIQALLGTPLDAAPVYSGTYASQGFSHPSLASLPNAALHAPLSYFSMDGMDSVYSLPTHQDPSTVSNFIPPTPPIDSGDFQQSFDTFSGIFRGNTSTIGHQEQLVPLTSQSALSVQPGASMTLTQQQRSSPLTFQSGLSTHLRSLTDDEFSPLTFQSGLSTYLRSPTDDEFAQEILAMMGPSQGHLSIHKEDHKANVAPDTAPSAPEPLPKIDQPKVQSGSHLPEENTVSENNPQVEPQTSDEMYYCELCNKWVLLRRRRHHEKKHTGKEYFCKICEVLGQPCRPLSRKDALKRHIKKKHPSLFGLLKNLALKILVPRRRNEPEDLSELRRAMEMSDVSSRLTGSA